MISKNPITWNEGYSYDGLLFFSQRIIEMLDYLTIDIYRAPLMNTPRLINEYLFSIEHNVRNYHLEHIFNEFSVLFRNDVILQKHFGQDWIDQRIDRLNKDKTNRKNIMHYLMNTIDSDYLEWTIEFIREAIPVTRNNIKLEKAIRCFVPELLRRNYSREEISHLSNRIIMETGNPENALEEFLGNYNYVLNEYHIYIGISNKMDRFRNILERRLGICFDDDGNFNKLHINSDYFIGVKKTEAYDARQAVKKAYSAIKLFVSFYKFFGNYDDDFIYSKALAISSKEEICIPTYTAQFKSLIKREFDEIGDFTEMSVSQLLFGEKDDVFLELKKLVKLHDSAISDNGLENGLINLWSILEILSIREKGSKDITQIIETVVPIMQRNYLKSIIIDIKSNIKRVLNYRDYRKLLQALPTDDHHENIACIILMPEYVEKYDFLYEKLINYPVLRTRIQELHNNHNTARKLYQLAEKYAKRITWHLYRIYRARNDIAHHGNTPNDVKDLGEHLHTYVDTVATEIIIKLAYSTYKSFSDIQIQSSLLHERMKAVFMDTSISINLEVIQAILNPDILL